MIDNADAYHHDMKFEKLHDLPQQNDLSLRLERLNGLPPRNLDLYPTLAKDRIVVVLYVHNRPQYLKVVVESLSQVVGISETLLIVSHDGYIEEMNKIIDGIKFCQVKQIYATYSPHLFSDSFPGVSANDCKEKDDAGEKHCEGNPDQYGNHRLPKIVSLKHHWWWMMNTVWNGLRETRDHSGHILFIEEDHFIFPNAYRNLQVLISLKPKKCPDCYAANLAPSDVNSRGEGWATLIAERMGNVGYSFNRTVWKKIHNKAREFCFFDDYNWDITMWATVYPSFGGPVYTLRGPRTSAVHFGRCGLHQGQEENKACIDNGMVNINVEEPDTVSNIELNWEVHTYKNQPGYKAGFKGWGGLGG
uniref:Alpha-1,6-mannosyl-glycoprotein 2-beta-N-acetylglucosaminyltransferase n=1 Tax=Glycine max TaxID=3847 RepID=C6TDM1_SOYBN|nr:unknown [Glycine max]